MEALAFFLIIGFSAIPGTVEPYQWKSQSGSHTSGMNRCSVNCISFCRQLESANFTDCLIHSPYCKCDGKPNWSVPQIAIFVLVGGALFVITVYGIFHRLFQRESGGSAVNVNDLRSTVVGRRRINRTLDRSSQTSPTAAYVIPLKELKRSVREPPPEEYLPPPTYSECVRSKVDRSKIYHY